MSDGVKCAHLTDVCDSDLIIVSRIVWNELMTCSQVVPLRRCMLFVLHIRINVFHRI